MKYQVSIVWC